MIRFGKDFKKVERSVKKIEHLVGDIIMQCPKCKEEYRDFDGFGVLHCVKCGYCKHASITGGVCEYCNKKV